VRSNVDSISGMFEITPFSSFGEFLDLEDFIVSSSRLEKYKKHTTGDAKTNRLNDQLYMYKLESIRRELNLFSRHFNLVAHAPATVEAAQKELCVLMPEVAVIEEVILVLNPIYTSKLEAADTLLQRMGFRVVNKKNLSLSAEEAKELFKEKSEAESLHVSSSMSGLGGEKLAAFLTDTSLWAWHLTKISGDREVR